MENLSLLIDKLRYNDNVYSAKILVELEIIKQKEETESEHISQEVNNLMECNKK